MVIRQKDDGSNILLKAVKPVSGTLWQVTDISKQLEHSLVGNKELELVLTPDTEMTGV